MNINRNFFYTFLFVILLLVIGLVYLTRNARHAPSAPPSAAGTPVSSEPEFPSDRPNRVDFTSMLDAPSSDAPSAQETPLYASGPSWGGSNYAAQAPGQLSSSSLPYRPVSARYAAGAAQRARIAAASSAPRSSSVSKSYTPGKSGYGYGASSSGASLGSASYEPDAEEASARENMFAGLTPRQTRQQQKALDQKLKNMSSGIERAIARAMTPKSKREQNIEKYLGRARGEGASMDGGVYGAETGQVSGDGKDITAQIAAQAQNVVNDVRANYGDKAAGRAGKIMDNFQKEMSDTLSAPGDPQEKQIRASALNNKYNQQLEELNRKEALNKMQAQMREENEKQLAAIREKFNPETEAAVRPLLEKDLQQRSAILSTPGDETQTYKRLIELDEQKRKDMESAVAKANPSDPAAAAKLLELQNEEAKRSILEREEAVKQGEERERAMLFRPETIKEKDEQWKKENDNIIKSFEVYGPEAAAKARQILDQARQRRVAAMQEGGTPSELNKKMLEQTENANAGLKQLAESSRQEALQNVEKEMDQNNEQFIREATSRMPQDVPDGLKAQWADKARAILDGAKQQKMRLLTSDGTPEEKQAAEQQINEATNKALSSIQLDAPAQ